MHEVRGDAAAPTVIEGAELEEVDEQVRCVEQPQRHRHVHRLIHGGVVSAGAPRLQVHAFTRLGVAHDHLDERRVAEVPLHGDLSHADGADPQVVEDGPNLEPAVQLHIFHAEGLAEPC